MVANGYSFQEKNPERFKQDNYDFSKHLSNFFRNSSKITALLILSGKVNKIEFENEDKNFFQEMAGVWYSTPDSTIPDLQKYSPEILLEQSITAAVSNWECYFSDVFEQILNDDTFIELIYNDKEKLKKFLNEFTLTRDFQNELFFNRNELKDLRFGTYVIDNRKINFQDPDKLKFLLNTLFDIDIVKIDETNWTQLRKFIKCRHKIVHKPSELDGYQKFCLDEIKTIIKSMAKIAKTVDKKLFAITYTKMRPFSNIQPI